MGSGARATFKSAGHHKFGPDESELLGEPELLVDSSPRILRRLLRIFGCQSTSFLSGTDGIARVRPLFAIQVSKGLTIARMHFQRRRDALLKQLSC